MLPFDRLVETHGSTVLRVCRSVLGGYARTQGGADEADDAWQETFISALRAWPSAGATLTDAGAQEAWLVTIARRRCIDILRRRGTRAVPVDDLAQLAGVSGPNGSGLAAAGGPVSGAPAASAETVVVDALPDPQLAAALTLLTDRQRRAVVLHHVGGLPHAEVAAALGCSPAAARRSSSDGVAALRRSLQPADPDSSPKDVT